MSILLCGCSYDEPKDTFTENYLYIDEDNNEVECIVIDPSKATKEYDDTLNKILISIL